MDIPANVYQDSVIDCFTCVLGERNPLTSNYTVLAMDHDARVFSQRTKRTCALTGDNGHVGRPVCIVGKRLVEPVMGRLAA
jgi:hypothetical protein